MKTMNIIDANEIIAFIKSLNPCPICGYPTFRKIFEDFERCHGCNWISNKP